MNKFCEDSRVKIPAILHLARLSYTYLSRDDATLAQYTKCIAPVFEQIRCGLNQNLQLSTLRDWLLPMLMNGQVSVGKGAE